MHTLHSTIYLVSTTFLKEWVVVVVVVVWGCDPGQGITRARLFGGK
jgi:hypothetical protein